MPTVTINWMAVVVATAAAMIIGAVWYSKLLFGKIWQKKVNLSDKDMREGALPAYLGMLVLALLTAFVLAHFVSYAQATTVWEGMVTGFWVWLGFVLPVLAGKVLFERRGKKLFLISAGNQLLALLVMGAILAAWA